MPFPQAVPLFSVIDPKACAHILTGNCGVCKEFCEAGAIDFDQKEEIVDLDVGSVIITTPQDIVAGYSCVKAAFHRFKELETSMAERDRAYEPRKVFRPMIVFNQVPDFKSGRSLFERILQE